MLWCLRKARGAATGECSSLPSQERRNPALRASPPAAHSLFFKTDILKKQSPAPVKASFPSPHTVSQTFVPLAKDTSYAEATRRLVVGRCSPLFMSTNHSGSMQSHSHLLPPRHLLRPLQVHLADEDMGSERSTNFPEATEMEHSRGGA